MSRSIAALGFALALVGAPALGLVGLEVCPPCCEHVADGPRADDAHSCAALRADACCDAAPAAQTPPAKRGADAPSSPASSGAHAAPPPAPGLHATAERVDVRWWLQPSRLSVVRRL